jgi:hypothetical protein
MNCNAGHGYILLFLTQAPETHCPQCLPDAIPVTLYHQPSCLLGYHIAAKALKSILTLYCGL